MSLYSYLFGAAAEQRERNRERRKLVHELDRVPYVMARLAELDKADSVALLDATRAAARRPDAAVAPVLLVHPTCVAAS